MSSDTLSTMNPEFDYGDEEIAYIELYRKEP